MNVRRRIQTASLLLGFTFAGCGEPTLVVENPLAVINVAPHDGAVGIDREVKPTVCFSEKVDASAAGQQLFLEDAKGGRVEGQVLQQVSEQCGAIRTPAPLEADSAYAIRIAKGLTSVAGRGFAADVTSRFTTGR